MTDQNATASTQPAAPAPAAPAPAPTPTPAAPQLGFDTIKIHSGYSTLDHFHSTSTPIYQTAAFDLETPERADEVITYQKAAPVYTRIGNPTVAVLEERIAQLDGGTAAIAFASGSAAVFSTLLLLGEGGGNIVAAPSLYGAIQEGFVHFLPKFGVDVRFVHKLNDLDEYESLIDENTRAVYLESISNPNTDVPDFERIAEVAHRHGVPVVVDNTVATPYLFRPFEHGVDIIVYSATKGLSGHGNVVAGLVVENGTFAYSKERFPQLHAPWWKDRDENGNSRSVLQIAPQAPITTALRIYYLLFFGAKLGPFDAYLALQGLATISERLSKQVANAKALVEYLKGNEHVEWVRYAGDPANPNHALAEKYFPNGVGGLLSFGFKGTQEQEYAFINALNIFLYEANLGDVRSLIVNSPKVTHVELEPAYLSLADVPDNLVRVSTGLEDAKDLIADLDQAFAKAFAD